MADLFLFCHQVPMIQCVTRHTGMYVLMRFRVIVCQWCRCRLSFNTVQWLFLLVTMTICQTCKVVVVVGYATHWLLFTWQWLLLIIWQTGCWLHKTGCWLHKTCDPIVIGYRLVVGYTILVVIGYRLVVGYIRLVVHYRLVVGYIWLVIGYIRLAVGFRQNPVRKKITQKNS